MTRPGDGCSLKILWKVELARAKYYLDRVSPSLSFSLIKGTQGVAKGPSLWIPRPPHL